MSPQTLTRDALATIPLQPGLTRLADEIRLVRRLPRPPALSDAMSALFAAELRLGLESGDAERAYEAAVALWRRTDDVTRCHETVARVLADAGSAWAEGRCDLATGHRIAEAAAVVLHRLRSRSTPGRRGRVVLAVPQGETHVLALSGLAHVLQEAGWTPDVTGALSPEELGAAARGAAAVVLSVHLPAPRLDALVAAVRAAEPRALVAVGGPAATTSGADLRTSEPAELLRALTARLCPLSSREQDVLRCIADGLTNAEAAAALGIAPATLKTHLDRIFDKTGAPGRAAAVAVGLRRGWIQ